MNDALCTLLRNKSFGDSVRTVHLRPSSTNPILEKYGYVPNAGRLVREKNDTVKVLFVVKEFDKEKTQTCTQIVYTDAPGFYTISRWAEYHADYHD